jgi:hypothetical protein
MDTLEFPRNWGAPARDAHRSLSPVVASETLVKRSSIPPRRGLQDAVEAANRVTCEIAFEYKVPRADFYAECLRLRPGQTWDNSIISEDGVHPSGGKVNVYTEENMKSCGYALRNWVNFLVVRELYFRVLDVQVAK